MAAAAQWKSMRRMVGGDPEDTRSAAASALVQSTLLGELLERAQIGVLAVDEGHYVAANEYACVLLGWERDELIGRRVGELHPLSALPAQFAQIEKGKRVGGEVTITKKSGEPIDLCYRAVPTSLAGMRILIGLFWPAT